jgi:DICT domain-containing protein
MRINRLVQLLLLLETTKADQPVHCLRDKIYGLWEFQVNTQVENINLFETNEVCSHQLTNKVQLMNKDHKFSFAQSETW